MTDSLPDLGFYKDVVQTLDEIQAPYVIIGGFAAAVFGSPRPTFDVDIIVDLKEEHIETLVTRYPLPRYYADPVQIRDSIRLGIMFNIIDTTEGRKVDLVPLSMDPRYHRALERRVRYTFKDASGDQMVAWFARPEDVIAGKLMAWAKGHSRRHEQDIHAMLVFIYLNADPDLSRSFDEADVDAQVATLGPEVRQLWKRLKQAARLETTTDS
jgi:hypothetical protein